MKTVKGHAAFHKATIKHGTSGTQSDRRALLKESMRHLNAHDVARHAQNNDSIVPADAQLNTGYVNDGTGGFCTAGGVEEVLDYGDERLRRVKRKIKTNQSTVDTFVVHLPKTLCVEIPNYYLRVNPDGSDRLDPDTRKPLSRSRWVARDQEQAMKYFQDAIDYLAHQVIPGGHAAIHGWATNFDESTPHIQLMADPFAPDPKSDDPDALRTEYNQAYGSHREVLDEHGKQVAGPVKMRSYQRGFREHMVSQRWPVEVDVSERHGLELPKAEFQEMMDMKTINELEAQSLKGWSQRLENTEYELNGDRRILREEKSAVNELAATVKEEKAGLPVLHRKAIYDGKKQGLALATKESAQLIASAQAKENNAAQILAQAHQTKLLADEEREELERLKVEATAWRNKYSSSVAQLESMAKRLQPVVDKWSQVNPHTDQGAKKQRMAAAIKSIEAKADDIRKNTDGTDDDYELD